ncbi:carbohydrate ABC transporter permease [Microbacterium radiodurans]|uniref:Sugar ABC transporter permease n=1 Tax=Microbacterium radiodurans TaxID=661398 RepID=A0A5J5ISV5_9MICO|nr:sugar ABC transporter permease [Microbacterium radiodurans]KAA9089174.1 sugar ABC transporter permease [Microbacterium radiodurans]
MSAPVLPAELATQREAAKRRPRRADHRTRSALLLLTPFAILFLGVMVAPIVYALVQSFFRVQRSGLGLDGGETLFAGIDNYIAALQNSDFIASFGRVFAIGVVQVPLMMLIALVLALLLDAAFSPLRRTFRLIFFLPYAFPAVIAAIMWSFLYQPRIGPFSDWLSAIGLDVNFLSSDLAFFSIGNMMTWGYTGFNMLIIYSALQAVPEELTEASSLDGAGWLKTSWYIKIPAVRPAIILSAVFSIIGTVQLYNDPAILAKVAPGISSTFTPIMAAQQSAAANNYNLAAAQSIILALVAFILSFGFLKFTQRKGADS